MEASTKSKPTLKPKESALASASASASASGHKKKIDPLSERIIPCQEGGIVVIRMEGKKVDVEKM